MRIYFIFFLLNIYGGDLTPAERSSLTSYTGNEFEAINNFVRTRGHEKPDIPKKAAMLELGIKKLPSFKGVVYRKSRVFPGGKNITNLPKTNEKQLLITREFLSTSQSIGILDNKSIKGELKMKIISFQGKNIKNFSVRPNEEEVLFLPGSKFSYEGKEEELHVFKEIISSFDFYCGN